MEFVFLTYLSTVADSLKNVIGKIDGWVTFITVASLIIGGFLAVGYYMSLNDNTDDSLKSEDKFDPALINNSHMYTAILVLKRVALVGAILSVFTTLLFCAIPKKTDVYIVMGGYVVTKAADSEAAKSISEKSLAAIERWLSKQIDDSQGTTNKSEPANKKQ